MKTEKNIQEAISYQQHGVLNLNKPKGLTSTQCLEKIKKALKQKKIGHAGTLDPMAEGVLVVLLGEATKLEPYLRSKDKVYWGWIKLGQRTDTYDTEGTILEERSLENITEEAIQSEINFWLEIEQQEVPEYSAAKYKGKPLYERKRKGEKLPQKTKSVRIKQVDILDMELPFVQFWVKCSPGTYIRSLAHSLGRRLGCGAVLTKLVREESYPFSLSLAQDLETVLSEPENLSGRILSFCSALADWPKGYLTQEQTERVKNGKWLKTEEILDLTTDKEDKQAILLSPQRIPVALVQSKQGEHSLNWAILRGFGSFN